MKTNKEIQVFYIHGYASPDEYLKIRYDIVTTVVYAGIKIMADGSLSKYSTYNPDPLIQYAHVRKTRVVLMFDPEDINAADIILSDPNIRTNVIQNLLAEVKLHNFDGVDNDIETASQINTITHTPNKPLMTAFQTELADTFWKDNHNYRISLDLPSADFKDIWDVGILQDKVSYMTIMGYEYRWIGDSKAGSVAPLEEDPSYISSIHNSINNYSKSVDKNKLLLGVPYYGIEWPTTDNNRLSQTTGNGRYILYKDIKPVGTYHFDNIWETPWYVYKIENQWYQQHFDNIESLGIKYDLVNSENLPGIGIWAINFGIDNLELWQLIQDKFTIKTKLGDSIVVDVTVLGTLDIVPTGEMIFDVSKDDGNTWTSLGSKTLDANGNAISELYVPKSTGTYHFRAKYLGDMNYVAHKSENKLLIVEKTNPILITLLSSA